MNPKDPMSALPLPESIHPALAALWSEQDLPEEALARITFPGAARCVALFRHWAALI